MISRVDPPQGSSPRHRWRAAVLAVVLASGCALFDSRTTNLVIIAIDTLRADHLGCYGYPRPTSPRIDRLASESVLFETAISQSSWTLPAFASMFTGLLPSYHRAGEGRFPALSRLDEAHPTLATVLKDAGYTTASFVSNPWVGAEVGLARGFDRHEQAQLSEAAVDRAVEWLKEQPAGDPFFLFVHIMDPHQPWAPLADDAALFIDPAYDGPIGLLHMGNPKPEWTDADRRRVVDLYDGEVVFADRQAGRVLDALASRDFENRSMVVLVSDHGEELFDHGWLAHGHTLYDELLQVPFMIRFPDGQPVGRVRRQVRTMDLFPTVLEALGIPHPTGINAVSLMPLVRGETGSQETDSALAEFVCFGNDIELKAIRLPEEKLILSPLADRVQLFDLAADPHEQHDLTADRPERAKVLRSRVEEQLVSAVDGFHLIARGGDTERTIRARFSAAAQLTDVRLFQAEPEDRYTLSPDGRRLEAELTLVPVTRPVAARDVDGIGFRTADGGPVRLESLAENGSPFPLARVGFAGGGKVPSRPLPWILDPADRGLVVRYPTPPAADRKGDTRIVIDFVRRGEAPTASVDAETLERLRAIGYLE